MALHRRAVGTRWCQAATTYTPGAGSEQGSPPLDNKVGNTMIFVGNLIINELEWAQPCAARCCRGGQDARGGSTDVLQSRAHLCVVGDTGWGWGLASVPSW